MITLTNGNTCAEISELGAEIRSLKKDGCEYMWGADPRVWGHTAPVLFPIVGALRDDKYVYGGKTYTLKKHGFVIRKPFAVESVTENTAVLLFTHSAETLKSYPFEFEFRVCFALTPDSLIVEYKVNNLGSSDMYFSVGAHEAYATPEGIEDYDLIFPQKEDLEAVLLNGPLLQDHTVTIAKNTEFLPLYDKYFMLDSLAFRGLKSHSVTLKNRKTERSVTVEYPDCDYLVLWHKPSAGYLCIEPWCGFPDRENGNYDFTQKEGIVKLQGNGVYVNTHVIKLNA